MLIAVGQINTTVGDMRGNVHKMVDFAQRAYDGGAELIVFPELAICDLVQCDGFQEENQNWLLELSRCPPANLTAINRNHEVIPKVCLEKSPSAELRPNQTDQDTLPPHEGLDQVLTEHIEENEGAEDTPEGATYL